MRGGQLRKSPTTLSSSGDGGRQALSSGLRLLRGHVPLAGFFHAIGAVPAVRNVSIVGAGTSWNYDTVLNIVLLTVIAVLGVRLLRTEGTGHDHVR